MRSRWCWCYRVAEHVSAGVNNTSVEKPDIYLVSDLGFCKWRNVPSCRGGQKNRIWRQIPKARGQKADFGDGGKGRFARKFVKSQVAVSIILS